MVGWHHWFGGHEFEQALGVGDGQESLVCCSPWGRKESDMTERLNWTKLNSKVDECYSYFQLQSWFVGRKPSKRKLSLVFFWLFLALFVLWCLFILWIEFLVWEFYCHSSLFLSVSFKNLWCWSGRKVEKGLVCLFPFPFCRVLNFPPLTPIFPLISLSPRNAISSLAYIYLIFLQKWFHRGTTVDPEVSRYFHTTRAVNHQVLTCVHYICVYVLLFLGVILFVLRLSPLLEFAVFHGFFFTSSYSLHPQACRR